MLHIPLDVRKSPLGYGHGTFAAVDIPSGSLLWSYEEDDPTVIRLTVAQASKITSAGLPALRWAEQDADGFYYLSVDGSQFMNHRLMTDPEANTLNCGKCGALTASRLITAGEEIFCDYTVDDFAVSEKLAGVSPSINLDRHPECANPNCG